MTDSIASLDRASTDERESLPPIAANAPALVARDLGKCYRIYDKPAGRLKAALLPWHKDTGHPFWALRRVSFEVSRGEAVGVLGRNGSGKSTLLQLAAGILQPSEGTIERHGRVSALLELGSGFNPDFTGRENVMLNGGILGISSRHMAALFNDIAEFADIGGFIEQPVKSYSSGMLMRLAFAVAVAVQPEILIVDEALAVGDIAFQRKCFRRIEEMRQAGLTLLLVTHDPGLVRQLCSSALVLDRGEAVGWGEPGEMADLYVNLLFGNHSAAGAAVETGGDAASAGGGQDEADALFETVPDALRFDRAQHQAAVFPGAEGMVYSGMDAVPLTPGSYELEVRVGYRCTDEKAVGVMVADWKAGQTIHGAYFPPERGSGNLQTMTFEFEVKEKVEAAEVRVIRYGAADVQLSNVRLYRRAAAQSAEVQPVFNQDVGRIRLLKDEQPVAFETARVPMNNLPKIGAQEGVALVRAALVGADGRHRLFFRVDEEVQLIADLLIEKPIGAFQFGILVRDRFGRDIFGQGRSSLQLGLPERFQAGARIRIRSHFRAHIRQDVYFITIGVRDFSWVETYFYGMDLMTLPILAQSDNVFGIANLPHRFAAEMQHESSRAGAADAAKDRADG